MGPTALNKRGNKVKLDGYTFDSSKEAYFYTAQAGGCMSTTLKIALASTA